MSPYLCVAVLFNLAGAKLMYKAIFSERYSVLGKTDSTVYK